MAAPTQEEIMVQIVELVTAGAGESLPPALQTALRNRYFGWIVATKQGNTTSPQEIWNDEAGKKIQQQIEKIGKHLAEKKQQKKSDLTEAEAQESFREVELNSACPHCP